MGIVLSVAGAIGMVCLYPARPDISKNVCADGGYLRVLAYRIPVLWLIPRMVPSVPFRRVFDGCEGRYGWYIDPLYRLDAVRSAGIAECHYVFDILLLGNTYCMCRDRKIDVVVSSATII